MQLEDLYKIFKSCTTVATDTRKLTKDSMYFALKGANFNGNNFVDQAFKSGAKYCLVDAKDAVINDKCLLVEDVLTTLQQLATYHRKAINIPIIALTGSNGKTTTKELINAVLATSYKVKATKGNLNNHIGVPLTLLSFSEHLDFGIVEMGANHQKEIELLCEIAQPDYGLITNFGKAHLEGFGGVEGVIKGKSELYNYLISAKKTVFINTDDALQIKQINGYQNIITFGTATTNNCTVKFTDAKPFVQLTYQNINIKSQLIGNYNFGNIAVAVAIGKQFKVTPEAIKKAVESYRPDNNRSEIIEKGTTKIILDAYNANPTSMLAALNNFKHLDAKTKVLFLGDMFELGQDSEKEHQAIINFVEANFETNIYVIGEHFYNTKTAANTKTFKSFEVLKPELKNLNLNNSTLLIKGSRGMALERVVDCIDYTKTEFNN